MLRVLSTAMYSGFYKFIRSSIPTNFCSPYTCPLLKDFTFSFTRFISIMSSSSVAGKSMELENKVEQVQLLDATLDAYGEVTVEIKEPMDPSLFSTLLKASISQWRQMGKKVVWIKIPIQLANLIDSAVKEGFWYHHAEKTYVVYWIPKTPHTIPANASRRVGICAVNNEGEMGDNADIRIQVNMEDNNGVAAPAANTIPKIDLTREQEYDIPIEFHGAYFAFNALLFDFIQLKSSGQEKIPNLFKTHPVNIIICVTALCIYFSTIMLKMKFKNFHPQIFNHVIVFAGFLTTVSLISILFP